MSANPDGRHTSHEMTHPIEQTADDDEDDEGGYPWFKGNAADPARAWLLAILKAHRAQVQT